MRRPEPEKLHTCLFWSGEWSPEHALRYHQGYQPFKRFYRTSLTRTPMPQTFGYLSALLAALALSTTLEAQATVAVPRPATAAVSAPITNVRYTVTANEQTTRTRSIRVSMTFDVTGAGAVLLSLPAWTPGAYEISNFAKNVYEFSARPSGAGGAPSSAELDWDKLDYDTWRVNPGTARSVTVTFAYRADTLDTAQSWTAPDLAM